MHSYCTFSPPTVPAGKMLIRHECSFSEQAQRAYTQTQAHIPNILAKTELSETRSRDLNGLKLFIFIIETIVSFYVIK